MQTLKCSQMKTNLRPMRLVGFRAGVLISEEITSETLQDRRMALTAEGFTCWVTDEEFPDIREYQCGGYMQNKPSQ